MKWQPASGQDVQDITELSREHFVGEVSDIFDIDPIWFQQQLTVSIVQQFFDPSSSFVWILRDPDTQRLLAYTWLERGQRTVWSRDEMVVVKMAHVLMTLSTRQRVAIMQDMLVLWRAWAANTGVPIIASTTVRHESQAFLRLHQRAGFTIQGSVAYLRLKPSGSSPASTGTC